MRVQLPSHGILGQRTVNLDMPRMSDLVYMSEFNENDNLHEYEIVSRLTDADMTQITWFDCQYIYALIVMSLCNATLEHDVICSNCGKTERNTVTFDQLEIVDLDMNDTDFTVKHKGKSYKFKILSAQDVADCIDMAQYEDNEDITFEHCKVAMTYGLKAEDWKFALELTTSEYMTALVYERHIYHGFVCVSDMMCKDCGHETHYRFRMNPQFAKFDFEPILDVYSRFMKTSLTLNDVMNLSFNEFNTLIKLANKLVDEEKEAQFI